MRRDPDRPDPAGARVTEFPAILADNRLSEEARIIGLWISTAEADDEGWVEVRFDQLRGILYGFPSDDTIRKHMRMLRGSGWAERNAGGKGRGDLYRIIDPHRSGSKDRPASNPGLTEDRPATEQSLRGDRPDSEQSLRGPISHQSSSISHPSAPARAPEADRDGLRAYLDAHADVVDRFDRSAEHPTTWASAVLGSYGPSGTQLRHFEGIDEGDRAETLAAALDDYAGGERPFATKLFRGYLRDEIRRRKSGERDPPRRPSSNGSGRRESPITKQRTYTPTEKVQWRK